MDTQRELLKSTSVWIASLRCAQGLGLTAAGSTDVELTTIGFVQQACCRRRRDVASGYRVNIKGPGSPHLSTVVGRKLKITQIPVPGGSGRVPTGAIQFQDDWPGLFLRGDTAVGLLSTIRGLRQRLAQHPDPTVGALLAQLEQIAQIIEKDVIVRGEPPKPQPLA